MKRTRRSAVSRWHATRSVIQCGRPDTSSRPSCQFAAVQRRPHHVGDLAAVERRSEAREDVRLQGGDQIVVRGAGRERDDPDSGTGAADLAHQGEVVGDRGRGIGDRTSTARVRRMCSASTLPLHRSTSSPFNSGLATSAAAIPLSVPITSARPIGVLRLNHNAPWRAAHLNRSSLQDKLAAVVAPRANLMRRGAVMRTRLALVFFLGLAITCPAFAQTQITTGVIQGVAPTRPARPARRNRRGAQPRHQLHPKRGHRQRRPLRAAAAAARPLQGDLHPRRLRHAVAGQHRADRRPDRHAAARR